MSVVEYKVKYVTVANFYLIRYSTGTQCNCLVSGGDVEKRSALSTTRAKQFYTR